MIRILILSNELASERKFLNEIEATISDEYVINFYTVSNRIYTRFNKLKFNIKHLKKLWYGNLLNEYVLSIYLNHLSKKILKKNNPNVVIVGTDNSYFSLYIVKNANTMKIKTIVIPFSLSNQEELVAASRRVGRYFNSRFLKKFILKKFNKWFVEDERNKGMYLKCPTSPYYLVQEALNLSPNNPWVICGGNSDYVLVNSQFEKDYYIDSGVEIDKIKIYSKNIKKVYKKIEIDKECKKNYLLWSVPPDHLNQSVFNSHKEMVEWHIQQLGNLNQQVIISPHPRISAKYMETFELYSNMTVSNNSIQQLVSECSYFIASQSATIRFALANKKYVINFKFYNLPYTEYSNLPMVYEVESKDQFLDALKRININKLFNGTEYDKYDENYFESNEKNINKLIEEIYKNNIKKR